MEDGEKLDFLCVVFPAYAGMIGVLTVLGEIRNRVSRIRRDDWLTNGH